MASIIKKLYGRKHDVIACGIMEMSFETRDTLFNWADKIIFMEAKLLPIPEHENSKFCIADVGKDVWKNPRNDDLLFTCMGRLRDLKLNL